MFTSLEPAQFTVTVLPGAEPALRLATCGLCGRETFVTLTLSDDHPCCCRQCFRQRVAGVRASRKR